MKCSPFEEGPLAHRGAGFAGRGWRDSTNLEETTGVLSL